MSAGWYWANSAGSSELLTTLANQCVEDFPELLLQLAKMANFNASQQTSIILDQIQLSDSVMDLSEKLKKAFDKYGSDKANVHNYHLLYAAILESVGQDPSILEIGLGTNNTDIASNMGEKGKPGASIRAFREVFPDAHIIGADIDETIKVKNETILPVDQTKLERFSNIHSKGLSQYQLIIDDGLHAPNANINTLTFALGKLANNGVIVIEDIPDQALDIWALVSILLQDNYRTALIRTAAASVFVCTPKTSPFLLNYIK